MLEEMDTMLTKSKLTAVDAHRTFMAVTWLMFGLLLLSLTL